MASFSSLGIGSGLDLNTLLTGLVNVEKRPITILQNQQSDLKSQLSAMGQIKSAVSSLQSASDALKTSASFAAYTATSTDSSVVSASATTGAVAGSYKVEVTQLSQAQKVMAAFASGTTFSGTLKLELGKADAATATGFTANNSVDIDLTGKTLAGARDAINAAGLGVTATIINDGSGTGTPYRLVVTSQNGGTGNQIRMTGVAGLNYSAYAGTGGPGSKDANVAQSVAAQDAQFSIDGVTMSRSGNSVTDAIDGVTLNLAKQTTGTPVTVTIAKDPNSVSTKINTFVKAYNDLNKLLHDVTAYNATTKTAGDLSGDYSVRSIQQQVRTAAINTVSGSAGGYSRLGDIGVSLQADGSLSVDSTKLTAAISDPAKDISKLFTGASGVDGVATRVSQTAKALLDISGLVATRTDGINKSIRSLDDRISALQDRVSAIEDRYRKQFTALDTTIGQMNVTSQYLTQQLARLK
ncbi:flagellar filament capping protein FliD [Niveibacterium umoris]|uniref:Flagellar hook-associated protein 2 n=1 Tax=Niveibacterium umoris TaxID=1193620 RepID=A0A840BFX9_9RHOO|nr:flagellar filament capping protein FliD [Niveibacterium umoris]MBB4011920.1 flagellar hook-associated protein 2 [Niveibacterium umoris]